jgi:hypothetical protein
LHTYYPRLDADRLCAGIERHADGVTTDDLLIGSVWDADRLDLNRLEIDVDISLLSTDVARRVAIVRKRVCSAVSWLWRPAHYTGSLGH